MKAIDHPIHYSSPALEEIIQKKDAELKELARKHAKHLAGKNLPALTDESILPALGQFKSEYESLAALAHQHLQPLMHESEHHIESDFAGKKDKRLDGEIQKRKHSIESKTFELEKFDASVYYKIIIAGVVGFFICIGDTAYNIESFESVTDNLFSATLFSIGCSVTSLALAHCIPIMYKKFTSRIGRILFGSGMLTVVMLFFSVLAELRSQYLSGNDISVDSMQFIIINSVFFLATLFVSALLLPTWEEIKKNWRQFKTRRAIRKQKRKIHELFREKEKLRIDEVEHKKHCTRVAHYMDSCNHRINTLFHDCAEIFKSTNIAYRMDNKVPDCFNKPLPDIDVKSNPQKPNDQ